MSHGARDPSLRRGPQEQVFFVTCEEYLLRRRLLLCGRRCGRTVFLTLLFVCMDEGREWKREKAFASQERNLEQGVQ